MRLYPERATAAVNKIAHLMKSDGVQAARGIIRVINANMERALRVITVERGFDPRDFALMAFGGAGPMHASELALDLGIRHVVLPRNPGLLCAWGALGAPIGREYSLTIREAEPDLRRLQLRARPMVARARKELVSEGARASAIQNELWAEMRYRGQSYELEVKLGPHFVDDFHEMHQRTFGHSAPATPVEVVNLRLRAHAPAASIAPARLSRQSNATLLGRTRALVDSSFRPVPVYERDAIGPGARFNGPMIVVELSSTAYVSPEFSLRCDDYGNFHLELR
jgi:N-methylhydantoinase A